MQKKDRRHSRRVRITFEDPVPCQVYSPDDDRSISGQIVDLSDTGAGVKIDDDRAASLWRVGEEILLRLRLPGVLGPIRLSGAIRHQRPLGAGKGCVVGLELVGTQSASHYALQISRLKRFLRSRAPLGVSDLESRLL